MAALYPDNYPPALTPEQEDFLTTTINDWAIAHGLAVRPTPEAVLGLLNGSSSSGGSTSNNYTLADNGALATTAPITLFPSLWPLNCFHEALMIQTAYNELYSAVARDEEFLEEVVRE